MKTLRDDILDLCYDSKNKKSRNVILSNIKAPGISNEICHKHNISFMQYCYELDSLFVDGYIFITDNNKEHRNYIDQLQHEHFQIVVLTEKGINKIKSGGFNPEGIQKVKQFFIENKGNIELSVAISSLIISIVAIVISYVKS